MDKPRNRYSDLPIDPDFRAKMIDAARALEGSFNGAARGDDRSVGFVLLVFPFGAGKGQCNCVSNGAGRKDAVMLMKEMIALFEGQPEASGHG